MNFFSCFFLDKKHKEENPTAPQKANVMVEICWGVNSVIYKKESENEFFFITTITKNK